MALFAMSVPASNANGATSDTASPTIFKAISPNNSPNIFLSPYKA